MLLQINFNNGMVLDFVNYDSLEDAKSAAVEMAGYTGEDITITNEQGQEITRAVWYGVPASDDDLVLFTVGNGFYQMWNDELELYSY